MRHLPLLVVLLVSLLLSATALDWGLPAGERVWAFDELTPRQVQGAARRGFADGWVANYPPLHYRLLHLEAQAVRHLSSDWPELRPLARDTRLRRAGRWLSVTMATLLIWGVYRCARLYTDRSEACLAAAVAASCLPFAYYAKTANVDVPYLFWFVAALFFLGRILRHGRWSDHVLLAVTAVAAVATKDQAIALFVPLPAILFVAGYRRVDGDASRSRRLARACVDGRFLTAGGVAVASFVLMLNLPANWDGFVGHVRRLMTVSVKRFDVYEPTVSGHLAMAGQSVEHLAFAMSWPLLVAAVLGVAWALGRRGRAAIPLAYLLCAGSYYVFFVSVIRHNYVRFLLPITLVLAFFAASALAQMARRRAGRLTPLAVIGVLLVFAFARAAALDRLMLRDSRYAAETWLEQHAAGAKVAGLGRPQMLPRELIGMPWPRLRRLGVEVLAQRGFDYVVWSRSGILRPGEAALAAGLATEAGGFVRERCFATPRPWPMPATEGIYTNLDKINPEVCVLRRRAPPGVRAETASER